MCIRLIDNGFLINLVIWQLTWGYVRKIIFQGLLRNPLWRFSERTLLHKRANFITSRTVKYGWTYLLFLNLICPHPETLRIHELLNNNVFLINISYHLMANLRLHGKNYLSRAFDESLLKVCIKECKFHHEYTKSSMVCLDISLEPTYQ